VVYTEDNDDSTSGKELAEKGYTLPEYHFVAKYGGVVSEPGPVLEVTDWAKIYVSDTLNNYVSHKKVKIIDITGKIVFEVVLDDYGYCYVPYLRSKKNFIVFI
jgi:hypothetical protein